MIKSKIMIISLFDINCNDKLSKYIEHYYPECSGCIQLKIENEELKKLLRIKEQRYKNIEAKIRTMF